MSLASGFVLLVILTGGAIWFVHAEQADRESTRKAMAIVNQLYRLQSLLLDTETGQRGYLLTGDETYLAPYDHALAGIHLALEGSAPPSTMIPPSRKCFRHSAFSFTTNWPS